MIVVSQTRFDWPPLPRSEFAMQSFDVDQAGRIAWCASIPYVDNSCIICLDDATWIRIEGHGAGPQIRWFSADKCIVVFAVSIPKQLGGFEDNAYIVGRQGAERSWFVGEPITVFSLFDDKLVLGFTGANQTMDTAALVDQSGITIWKINDSLPREFAACWCVAAPPLDSAKWLFCGEILFAPEGGGELLILDGNLGGLYILEDRKLIANTPPIYGSRTRNVRPYPLGPGAMGLLQRDHALVVHCVRQV